MTGYSFQGASGKSYDYALIVDRVIRNLTQQSGMFILAKGTTVEPIPFVVRAATSLRGNVLPYAGQLINSLLYIHVDPASTIRDRHDEEADLKMAYRVS